MPGIVGDTGRQLQSVAPSLVKPRSGNHWKKLPPANSTTSRMANRKLGMA